MERVPPAGFQPDADTDAGANHLRRTQPLHAGSDEAERIYLLLHWATLTRRHAQGHPERRRTVSATWFWSPAAPATSAATPPRRCARPDTRWSSMTTCPLDIGPPRSARG